MTEKIPDTSQAERWLDPDHFIYQGKTYRVVMTLSSMIAECCEPEIQDTEGGTQK